MVNVINAADGQDDERRLDRAEREGSAHRDLTRDLAKKLMIVNDVGQTVRGRIGRPIEIGKHVGLPGLGRIVRQAVQLSGHVEGKALRPGDQIPEFGKSLNDRFGRFAQLINQVLKEVLLADEGADGMVARLAENEATNQSLRHLVPLSLHERHVVSHLKIKYECWLKIRLSLFLPWVMEYLGSDNSDALCAEHGMTEDVPHPDDPLAVLVPF